MDVFQVQNPSALDQSAKNTCNARLLEVLGGEGPEEEDMAWKARVGGQEIQSYT